MINDAQLNEIEDRAKAVPSKSPWKYAYKRDVLALIASLRELTAERDKLRQAVDAARSVFSEDGVRDVVSAFVQYQVFDDRVSALAENVATANEIERLRAERDVALAELATLKAPCTHRTYTESSNGRVRQCRKCFKSWDVRVGTEIERVRAERDAALAENVALWRVAHAFNAFQKHPLIPRWDDHKMYQSPGSSLWSLVRVGREALAALPPRGGKQTT